MTAKRESAAVLVIGAGIVGIATAYFLVRDHGYRKILIVDRGDPMAFTSAQSGENYRNWWPHPLMVRFTDRSIDLMEEVATASGDPFRMTRRGYALATRRTSIDDLIDELRFGLGGEADRLIRFQDGLASYQPPVSEDWRTAPDGVDVLTSRALIREMFPSFADDVANVIHIRRGGDIDSQQMGAFMLEAVRFAGGRRLKGEVRSLATHGRFVAEVETQEGVVEIKADTVVNAAGPFARHIAQMAGIDLPIRAVLQQKIAFEDTAGAVPRGLPFAIDLDGQEIDWPEEAKSALLDDTGLAWLAGPMPGSIHCRPDGGGNWIKLGWAYNDTGATPAWTPDLDGAFPEIVLRGAARLQPSLRTYYDRLPRARRHYGGWYAMTEENWPLVGPVGPEGFFVNAGHSGFGTMAACASGELVAAHVTGAALPDYASAMSPARYENEALMTEARASGRGTL